MNEYYMRDDDIIKMMPVIPQISTRGAIDHRHRELLRYQPVQQQNNSSNNFYSYLPSSLRYFNTARTEDSPSDPFADVDAPDREKAGRTRTLVGMSMSIGISWLAIMRRLAVSHSLLLMYLGRQNMKVVVTILNHYYDVTPCQEQIFRRWGIENV